MSAPAVTMAAIRPAAPGGGRRAERAGGHADDAGVFDALVTEAEGTGASTDEAATVDETPVDTTEATEPTGDAPERDPIPAAVATEPAPNDPAPSEAAAAMVARNVPAATPAGAVTTPDTTHHTRVETRRATPATPATPATHAARAATEGHAVPATPATPAAPATPATPDAPATPATPATPAGAHPVDRADDGATVVASTAEGAPATTTLPAATALAADTTTDADDDTDLDVHPGPVDGPLIEHATTGEARPEPVADPTPRPAIGSPAAAPATATVAAATSHADERVAATAATVATGSAAPEAPDEAPPAWRQVAAALRTVRGLDRTPQEMSIELSPGNLGHVRIDASLHRGVLDVVLRAETPDGQHALRAGLAELRAEVEATGVRPGSLEVRPATATADTSFDGRGGRAPTAPGERAGTHPDGRGTVRRSAARPTSPVGAVGSPRRTAATSPTPTPPAAGSSRLDLHL